MAPLTARDDFSSSSPPNTALIIGIVAGVVVGLSILIAIVKTASRASGSRPQTRTTPRPQVSGNATDYLRPEENRVTRTSGWVTSTRTAGNNDTILMRENNRVVMTLDSDTARVASMSPPDEASVPLVHAPASPHHSPTSPSADGRAAHPSMPTPAVLLAPVRRPAPAVAASVQDSDPPPPYSVVSSL